MKSLHTKSEQNNKKKTSKKEEINEQDIYLSVQVEQTQTHE